MYICIVILSLLCIYLITYILQLKHGIRNIKKELFLTKDKSYNRQITISLFDKDLSLMTVEINKNLDYQKKLKLESEKAEHKIKQSVSDIAHDLRTPLTVIKGNLQMIEQKEFLSEKGIEYLNICNEKADTIKKMADDFFELSILESDCTTASICRVNATNMLMQFIAENEAVIRIHNLTPDIHFPEKSVFINADEQMLMRIFSNLLNNIIKYAKDTFLISMEILDNDKCRITFANAVDEGQQFDTAHLFDRTYRGDKARRGSGAGLGLYIVKLLAEKQNAEVQAVNENNHIYLHVIFNMNKRILYNQPQ